MEASSTTTTSPSRGFSLFLLKTLPPPGCTPGGKALRALPVPTMGGVDLLQGCQPGRWALLAMKSDEGGADSGWTVILTPGMVWRLVAQPDERRMCHVVHPLAFRQYCSKRWVGFQPKMRLAFSLENFP